jgi:hypothetical protein
MKYVPAGTFGMEYASVVLPVVVPDVIATGVRVAAPVDVTIRTS